MEVKVTFEDFDLEAEVDKAIVNKINSIVGTKINSMMHDNNISFVSISEQINITVGREVTRMINGNSSKFNRMIEQKIDKMVDENIEGIIRNKVAKIMSPYISILEDKANGNDHMQRNDKVKKISRRQQD